MSKVNLGFFARSTLDAAERQRTDPPQAAQEPPYAVVTNRGAVLANQVLMNPPGR